MTTPVWKAGTLYSPGALVQPTKSQPIGNTQPDNPAFETGDLTGWTTPNPSIWSVETADPYSGVYSAKAIGGGVSYLQSTTHIPVAAGQTLTAITMCKLTNNGTDDLGAQIGIDLFDATDTQIGTTSLGTLIYGKGGFWTQSSVTAAATKNAEYALVRLGVNTGSHGGHVNFDSVRVTSAYQAPPPGLIFKAVQSNPGRSAATEPTWPTVNGVTVVDNEVTWEAIILTRLVWEASPILLSGGLEPAWPTDVGAFVSDNTINWQAVSRRVEDANCPRSKVVAILSSKVFAADKDIVRFCATVNPLDWTTAQDAGYLPTGLQQANSNDMSVLAPYRSNLTAFNASSFQNWQVDPDPSAMALLDQMEGIGSTWTRAAQPVGNELFFLSALGVRSVSVSAASDSLSAGDVGMPIDPLAQSAITSATANASRVVATYYPSAGQYWLAFADYPSTGVSEVYVYTNSGGKGKWSRYQLPWSVEAFAQLGNDLYIRHGDEVSIVDPSIYTDDIAGVPTDFTCTVQWHYLDCGSAGVTKMMDSIDIVGDGQGPSLSIGYDQRDLAAFTDPYAVDADTLTGSPIPIPVSAPSFSVKLDFAGGAYWKINAVNLHLADMPGQP